MLIEGGGRFFEDQCEYFVPGCQGMNLNLTAGRSRDAVTLG